MKIAIDARCAEGKKAGKGVYTFNLIKEMLSLSDKDQFILYGENGVEDFAGSKNVALKNFKAGGAMWHLKVYFDLLKVKPDVFFAPSSFIVPAFLPDKIKSVVSVHDLVAILYPEGHNKKALLIENLLLKRVLKKAAKILCVSENTKKDLKSKFKFPADKACVVYCGVNDDFFRDETMGREKFFLSLGTIIPRKNHKNLIKAFCCFSKKHPDFKLKIAGGKGWKFQEVFDEVKKNKIPDKVDFLGYVDVEKSRELYNKAFAFVFPSLYEGFGIPPLEAMKCGCPVIASNISSIPEVLGNCALFVDPHDVSDLSAKMELLLRDFALREQLIEKGFSKAREYSWKKSASEILKIFRGIK